MEPSQTATFDHSANNLSRYIVLMDQCPEQKKEKKKTRKQNMQANSRSACQFWHQREKKSRNYTKSWKKYSLSIPGCRTLGLFSLYEQMFSKYGPIFKISIFGQNIRNLKKSSIVAYVPSFDPQRVETKLIFLYEPPFSRYRAIFKIPY